MGSKSIVFVCLFLAMVLMVSSEVAAARDLAETTPNTVGTTVSAKEADQETNGAAGETTSGGPWGYGPTELPQPTPKYSPSGFTPVYGQPRDRPPVYRPHVYGQVPSYRPPVYGQPYGLPNDRPPVYGQPSYGLPSDRPPVYNRPTVYGQPSYGLPSDRPPVYGQPSYGLPSDRPPVYGQPSYGLPSDRPPVYGPP